MRRNGTRRHRLSQNTGTILLRPAAPRLAARHNLHHRSSTTRRSALSSALSHTIIHHSRLQLTSKAQIATLTGPGARWGPDSGYEMLASAYGVEAVIATLDTGNGPRRVCAPLI
jgi:hypothetical protein